jgi:hypothetical protein
LLALVQRTDGVANKNRLLVMAEAWLDLAGRATKITEARRRKAPDHPLVTATLGCDRPEVE